MEFVKKIFSYAVGNGLSKFIAVIILPIYTNYLNPEAYGKADLSYYTVSITVSFVFMECWTALLRFIYDDYTEQNKKKVLSNIFILTLSLLVPYIIVQYIISIFIGREYAILSCLYGTFYMFLQIFQMYARAIKKSKNFVVSGVINSIIQLVIAYIMIVILNMDTEVVLIGPTIGAFVACLYLVFTTKCIRKISFKYIDKNLIKKIFIFSIPLSFNSIAFWAMNNINRYFAAYLIDYEASSYVSIASKLTMIITLAASVYSLAWQENAFENSNNDNKKTLYSRMFSLYITIFSIATAFSIIFIKLIFPIIIGEDYNEALGILPPYFIAVYFSGVSSFLGQIFGAEKKTTPLLTSTIIGTIVNILIVVPLVNKIGIMIIPIGSLLGYLSCVAMRYYRLHNIIDIKFDIKDVLKALAIINISLVMFYCQNGIIYFIVFVIILITMIYLLYHDIINTILSKLKKGKLEK